MVKSQAGSESLRKLSAILENEEVRREMIAVVEKKYAAPQIKNLTQAEITTEAANCLRRIHVITGWNLPDDVEYMKMLLEEFTNKLKEDFYMMNFQEISFAFRKNGLGIKDWGKNMNLDLICNVLGHYCAERERISFEEERLVTEPPVMKVNTDEEIDNLHRKWTEEFYQRIRSGQIEMVPAYCEDILVKDGLLKAGSSVSAFFVKVLNEQRKNIYAKQ